MIKHHDFALPPLAKKRPKSPRVFGMVNLTIEDVEVHQLSLQSHKVNYDQIQARVCYKT
jgi:hypothetical protein